MVFVHRTLDPVAHVDLSDATWALVEPVVNGTPRGPGRPARDHRMVVNGILWVLETGAPWRQVPSEYGPWQTLYGRYVRWREDGTWQRVEALLAGDRRTTATGSLARTVTMFALAILAASAPVPRHAGTLVGRERLRVASHLTLRGGRRRQRRLDELPEIPRAQVA